jgi:4-hydroxy-tetrahydrodipicolinate synthase
MMKRGLLSSAAQRKPAANMSAIAEAEVDYLLKRLAKYDSRARLA